MPKISATILVKNGQKHIERVLSALKRFDEIALLDTGSEDATLDIASKFANVTIHKGPFLGFGKSHNLLSSLAKHDWILSIDADEVLTKDLADEIFALELQTNTVYSFWRKNYYRGKWIKGCGWYPDRTVRLYNRTKTSFTDAEVHEAVNTKGLTITPLQGHIEHYPYETIGEFLAKMQSYSTLFARQYTGKKKSSLFHALGHGLFAVLKSYFLKRGFLLGHEGFVISLYNGHTAYYKYLKLQEMNRNVATPKGDAKCACGRKKK